MLNSNISKHKSILIYGILGFNILPNINVESRVSNVVGNHETAVTVACASYAKGGCTAVKLAKASASAALSSESSEKSQESKPVAR